MLNPVSIPSETTVDAAGSSIHISGGPTGVLAIHGWTGNTQEMAYLASRLAQARYTVSVPRLPGHGTNAQDFMRTTWRDWLRRAVDAYLDLLAETERVYVAGLSMGGVLTAILASMFDVPRIALYAPAITNHNRLIVLTPVLRFFIKRYRIEFDDQEVDPILRPLAREYWHDQWILPAYHLYKLQRLALRRLPRVRADTLVFVSRKDESVPVRAADIVSRRAKASKFKRIDLTESDHVLVNGVDKERVADETIAWFDRE